MGAVRQRTAYSPTMVYPMSDVTSADLKRIRAWAQDRIAQNCEPPWAWYQYMKLIETLDAICAGAAVTTESSQRSHPHRDGHLRLVGAADPQSAAQPRPADSPICLPM